MKSRLLFLFLLRGPSEEEFAKRLKLNGRINNEPSTRKFQVHYHTSCCFTRSGPTGNERIVARAENSLVTFIVRTAASSRGVSQYVVVGPSRPGDGHRPGVSVDEPAGRVHFRSPRDYHLSERLAEVLRQERVQYRVQTRVGVRQTLADYLHDDADGGDLVIVDALQHQYDLQRDRDNVTVDVSTVLDPNPAPPPHPGGKGRRTTRSSTFAIILYGQCPLLPRNTTAIRQSIITRSYVVIRLTFDTDSF